MERVAEVFASFADADRADEEYYASLTPAEREELYPGELAKLGIEGNPDAVRIVACAQSELANEYTNAKNVRTGAFTEALLELFAEVGDAPVSWAVLGPAIRAPTTGSGSPGCKVQLCQRNSCALRCEPWLSFTLTSAGPGKFIASSRAPRRSFGSST